VAAASPAGRWPARRPAGRQAGEERERSIWRTPLPGAGPVRRSTSMARSPSGHTRQQPPFQSCKSQPAGTGRRANSQDTRHRNRMAVTPAPGLAGTSPTAIAVRSPEGGHGQLAPLTATGGKAVPERCSYVLSRLSFRRLSPRGWGLLRADKTRMSRSGGGQALIRSLGSRQLEVDPGRPADRSKASTGRGSRIAGQAAPGAGGRQPPRGRWW